MNHVSEIKVCHIITGLNKGGAEVFLLQLCKSLNQISTNSNMVLGLKDYSDLLDDYQTGGIETTVLGMRKNPVSFVKNLNWAIKYCKENKVRILHAHMAHSLLFAVSIKLFMPKVKLIFTAHSIKLSSKPVEYILQAFKPFRQRDIIFSARSKQAFNSNHTEIIPNGIDFSQFLTSGTKKNHLFTYIAVGRLEGMKNHIALIENFNKLRNRDNVQLLIIGEGSQRNNLLKAIQQNNLENKVFLTGKKENVAEYLHQSHCFLLPSLWEGFPISLLEAGSAGLPCIVTKIQAVIDNISEDSLIVSPIDKFAESMDFVFENYEQACQQALKLKHELIEKFGIEQVAQKHWSLYKTVLEE